MRLIIVSGLSGSGKSIALHVLEDLGYYCIDNLPIGLLPALAEQVVGESGPHRGQFAVGIDARTLGGDLEGFPAMVEDLESKGLDCDIFFLEANDATLLQRFSETRRRHPLSNDKVPLNEAIEMERRLLEPLSARADLIVDTSLTNVHQLRDLIRERVSSKAQRSLSVLLESFGYKHGVPADADFVFDVRCIPNPHWEPELRALTGRDQPVADYLARQPQVEQLYSDLEQFLERWLPEFEADNRSYMTIAIGCTGGQHRSVYLVERLAGSLEAMGRQVLTRHRELQ
ncbi:MAG TPA: RNase adapter RapZ [Gammaproteobacteria bacterium]|nr:RNase adapter RapZ [Gammaproteobacteria bacterium]